MAHLNSWHQLKRTGPIQDAIQIRLGEIRRKFLGSYE